MTVTRILTGEHLNSSMAMVVPCASCYAQCSVQPLQLFGKTANCNYLALISYRGPRSAPRPRLTRHAPKMTLRQICRLLKVMKQVKTKEAAAAATTRKPGSAAPVSSPIIRSDKKCLPVCFRRKRNISIKRAG